MPDAPLLEIKAIDASYGDFQALFDVSLSVGARQVIAVIGANGAGKSTLLKTVAGLMHPHRGEIIFNGAAITDAAAFEVVKHGIALVPEGRRLFPSLTVEENLLIGGHLKRPGPWSLARIYELFPVLAERRHFPATALSGGQQQMAAIGRALMANPQLLLCDEISLGLAPIVVRDIYACLPQMVAEGLSLIIVEQDIAQAFACREPCLLSAGRPCCPERIGARSHARDNLCSLFRDLTAMQWFNIVLQGVLIGGLYAMFAAGLSLIFGVMRLVNIAHGDLIVLAAYVSLMVTQAIGVDPLVSLLLVVPVMALVGYGLQRGLLNRTLGDDLLPPLLVTFGLSIIIQNGLLELFTADSRSCRRAPSRFRHSNCCKASGLASCRWSSLPSP